MAHDRRSAPAASDLPVSHFPVGDPCRQPSIEAQSGLFRLVPYRAKVTPYWANPSSMQKPLKFQRFLHTEPSARNTQGKQLKEDLQQEKTEGTEAHATFLDCEPPINSDCLWFSVSSIFSCFSFLPRIDCRWGRWKKFEIAPIVGWEK